MLFSTFYIPQTTKVETRQKSKDQPPLPSPTSWVPGSDGFPQEGGVWGTHVCGTAYVQLCGTRLRLVSRCPVAEFHSLGREGHAASRGRAAPSSSAGRERMGFLHSVSPAGKTFVQRPLPSSSQPQAIAPGFS